MKKLLFVLVFAFVAISVDAQTVQNDSWNTVGYINADGTYKMPVEIQ
ncbi:MAG: hypothetical protein JKY54_15385 [Flavobacteriales bacterium]|nr:hypothetical protein [Flavobacteriales bacterium]